MFAVAIAATFIALAAGTDAVPIRNQLHMSVIQRPRSATKGGGLRMPKGGGPIHPTYPLYKQCDPRWGSNEMGVPGPGERSTICGEGCAMSSTSMVLAGLGVTLDGELVNPGTLNKWLMDNNGYLCAAGDCNNLNLTFEEDFTNTIRYIGETPPGAYEQIAYDIEAGAIAHLAHVNNRTHFVLLTAVAKSEKGEQAFEVHDPFFNRTTYLYSDIADIIRYKIVRYPLFKQCDPKWGSDQMGTDDATICQVGCLMSSISSAIAGTDIPINGKGSNPGVLNAWLRANGGYTSGSDLEESVVPKIAPTRIAWPKDG